MITDVIRKFKCFPSSDPEKIFVASGEKAVILRLKPEKTEAGQIEK